MTGATELDKAEQPGPPGAVLSSDGLDINWEAERSAFELWFCRTQTKNPVRARAKADTGTYIDGITRAAWRAWRHAVMRGATGKAAVVDA